MQTMIHGVECHRIVGDCFWNIVGIENLLFGEEDSGKREPACTFIQPFRAVLCISEAEALLLFGK